MTVTGLIILSVPVMVYFLFSLILRHGLNQNYETNFNRNFSVSVIVAARNEAENIEACLLSLEQLDYPEKLLEILIVNDRSEDETEQIICQFIQSKPRFQYHHIKETVPHLSGKASAISQALRHSHGEIIVITDADCLVPKNWVRNLTAYFTHSIGLVAGFTLLDGSRNLFYSLQNMDWLYMLSVAAGAIGLRMPLTCMGNNFAFRRAVYEEVGGYERVGFSVTEDFALLKTIAQTTSWKIIFPLDFDCLVTSQPLKSLKDFLSQRKRWAVGGRSVHWLGKILIATSIISHFVCISLFLFNHYYLIALLWLAIILISDYLLLELPSKQLNAARYLKYLPLYKIFFILYSTILLLNLVFNRKITWKGIQYN